MKIQSTQDMSDRAVKAAILAQVGLILQFLLLLTTVTTSSRSDISLKGLVLVLRSSRN